MKRHKKVMFESLGSGSYSELKAIHEYYRVFTQYASEREDILNNIGMYEYGQSRRRKFRSKQVGK